jgi:N-acetylneuraminic acid mutarotase
VRQSSGFPTDVWSYQPGAKAWNLAGKMPQDLVSTGIAKFGEEFVIPGGEIRPAVPSARVLAGRFKA